jgi:hypothetical protein
MIDPPPLIGPATPLRRVERTSRDRDPGRRQHEHGNEPKQDEREPENEGGDGVHIDVRV